MATPAGSGFLLRRALLGRPLRNAALSATAFSSPSTRRPLSAAATAAVGVAASASNRLHAGRRVGRGGTSSGRLWTPEGEPSALRPAAAVAPAANAAAAAPTRRCFSSSEAPGGGGSGYGGAGAKETGPAIALGSALRFETIVDGKPMVPEDFEGKAVLVVNTASLCGLTPQLKELELVHKRFENDGLVVLGVPSNDFGAQEPWEEEKIREFYTKDFGVTFPLTSKTVVVGPEAHPLYSAVIDEFGADVGPQWNFHKLLVGADGALAGVFGSNLSPLEPDVTEAIEEALPAKEAP